MTPPPRFTVFKFEIYAPDTGIFYFRAVRDPKLVMARSHAQLHTSTFLPFLIDYKAIDAYAENLHLSLVPPPPPTQTPPPPPHGAA